MLNGSTVGAIKRLGLLLLMAGIGGYLHAMDPTKTVGGDECIDCHTPEHDVWSETTHARTYEELSSSDAGIDIADALGLDDIEAPDGTCVGCHYTLVGETLEDAEPISGISCESCHGAAVDWINGHGEYLSGDIDSETPAQKKTRIDEAIAAGQIRPDNIYAIAANCLECHSIPDEELVNTGGHPATSEFELVEWSQGEVRHNLFWNGGAENAIASPERRRVMYVVGLATDLEFSLRALGRSSEAGDFRDALSGRVSSAKSGLSAVNGKIDSSEVSAILSAIGDVNLSSPEASTFNAVADKIKASTISFADSNDGSGLAALDGMIPSGEGRYSEKYQY